jgi:hypothetical protein
VVPALGDDVEDIAVLIWKRRFKSEVQQCGIDGMAE